MISHPAPRILICCLRGLSQGVAALPTLCALRDRFPQARLAWLCEPELIPLLEGHQALDQLIGVRSGWQRSLSELRRLRARLRACRFDAALDLDGQSSGALAGWLSAARLRIGSNPSAGTLVRRLLNSHLVAPTLQEPSRRNLELLEVLGVQVGEPRFDLPRDRDAEAEVQRWIVQSHLGCGFLLIHPGRSIGARLDAGLGRVARGLGERYQIPSVVAAQAATSPGRAARVVAHAGGHAIATAPLDLPQLGAMMRRAAAVLTLDPAASMLATAVDCPRMGLSAEGLAGTDPMASLEMKPLLSLLADVREPARTRGRGTTASLARAA